MVDVTHDGNNRGSDHHVFGFFPFLLVSNDCLFERNKVGDDLKGQAEFLSCFLIEGLVDVGGHDSLEDVCIFS